MLSQCAWRALPLYGDVESVRSGVFDVNILLVSHPCTGKSLAARVFLTAAKLSALLGLLHTAKSKNAGPRNNVRLSSIEGKNIKIKRLLKKLNEKT